MGGEVVPNVSLLENDQKLKYRRKVKRIVTFDVIDNASTVLLNNCTNIRYIKVNDVLTEPNEENQIIVTESGTYEIELDFIGKEISSDIFISSFTETSLITSFSDDFFYAMKNIPMTGAVNVTAINIPYSIERIDDYAFYKNKKITNIKLPNSVKSLGMQAFRDCTLLSNIKLSDNLELIDSNCFRGCTGLINIEMPKSIKIINNNAFYGCKNITNIYISNIDSWLDIEFGGYSANPLYYGTSNLYLNSSIVENININKNVGNYAFYKYSKLKTVTVESDITAIGNNAFKGCSELTHVNIPDSITTLGDYAFDGCGKLTEINIPSSLTYLGSYCFNNCSNLEIDVNIPGSVQTLNAYTFANCSKISSVVINDGCSEIYANCFNGCSDLQTATLPLTITSIYAYVFQNCTSLSEITCYATTAPNITSSTFQNVKTDGVLKVPTDATGYDAWMSTSNYYLGKYNWTLQQI